MKTNLTLLAAMLAIFSLSNRIFAQTPFLVKNINTASGTSSGSSSPSNLTDVNGTLFFTATDPVNGTELWKSDGTPAGTILVKDINIGTLNSNPSLLTNVNGILFFAATDAVNGTELWKSDGTDAGTVKVKDIYPGTASSNLSYLTNVNGTLFFSAMPDNAVTYGYELWKSDGTDAGTVMVKDIRTGWQSSSPAFLTEMNNTLYFQANDGVNGTELWKSDGTDAGTIIVHDIASGSSVPDYLINVNGTLFFWADIAGGSGASNRELWKSDGSDAGTVLVKDINVGGSPSEPGSALPHPMLNVNGILYFIAYDGASGVGFELWKSDGTDAGTVRVKDINLGFNNSGIRNFTNINNTIYFDATDGSTSPYNGKELWKSDGTDAGTVIVRDIVSGTGDSSPNYITNANGVLYFAAGNSSTSLWKSDGLASGTTNLNVSTPKYLTYVNGILFFSGYDATNYQELWAINITTGIEENNNNFSPTIYPNPTTGIFQLTTDNIQSAKLELEIYNLLGEKVYMATKTNVGTNYIIDISNQPKGIYFVKIYDGDKIYSNKIVVQ